MNKKVVYSLLSIILMALGVFMFVYGGYDDSPGAQGLGLLMFIGGIVSLIKSRKNSK